MISCNLFLLYSNTMQHGEIPLAEFASMGDGLMGMICHAYHVT